MRKACLDLGACLFLDKAGEFLRLPAVLAELSEHYPKAPS
jgi:hypothetical protein